MTEFWGEQAALRVSHTEHSKSKTFSTPVSGCFSEVQSERRPQHKPGEESTEVPD